METCTRKV